MAIFQALAKYKRLFKCGNSCGSGVDPLKWVHCKKGGKQTHPPVKLKE